MERTVNTLQVSTFAQTNEYRLLVATIVAESELCAELEHILPLNVVERYLAQASKFGSERRRAEWLTARVIVAQQLPATYISYHPTGKPFLYGSPVQISVSHTGNNVAVLFTEVGRPGLDIQQIKTKITKLAHKFITEKEQGYLPEKEICEAQNLIWAAKESLYKIHGQQEVDFKEHLAVEPFKLQKEGQLIGNITKQSSVSVVLNYRFVHDFVAVWGIDKKQ